jgi:hypothetical protein
VDVNTGLLRRSIASTSQQSNSGRIQICPAESSNVSKSLSNTSVFRTTKIKSEHGKTITCLKLDDAVPHVRL